MSAPSASFAPSAPNVTRLTGSPIAAPIVPGGVYPSSIPFSKYFIDKGTTMPASFFLEWPMAPVI
jgi:hypothetical protein